MAILTKRWLPRERENEFPNLAKDQYTVTSVETCFYNCMAFAAGDETRWWEPDEDETFYWPRKAPREYTVEAYIKAFELLAYKKCDHAALEHGFQKIAIYHDPVGNSVTGGQDEMQSWRLTMDRAFWPKAA